MAIRRTWMTLKALASTGRLLQDRTPPCSLSRALSRALLLLAGGALACTPATDQGKLPPNVQDPVALHTPAGAMDLYRATLAQFPLALDGAMVRGAILTDELSALPTPPFVAGPYTVLDSRQSLSSFGAADYANLHRLRAHAREARGFLHAYAPDSSPALTGHLYAVEGYADVLLADLFCSGIPLSTMDFGADYTLAGGSSTAEVYAAATALFDSALTLMSDSSRLQYLAAVGKGRALLALGRYAEAALAVSAVPDDYRYQVLASGSGQGEELWSLSVNAQYLTKPGTPSVGDQEGFNGLPYRSSSDPRTLVQLLGQDLYGHDVYFPAKYPYDPSFMITAADGLEARLIEAEAALQAGSPDWLTKLNALRTDGTYETQPNANDPNQTDTLWHAGTGGVAGLRPLSDPGSADAGLDLVFRERAFWLYLTAHRQGDLRRLIRQYGRKQDAVYPTGSYPGSAGAYGIEVTFPVPESERDLNPKYTGCFHHNA